MSYEQPLFKIGEFPSDIDRSSLNFQFTAVAVASSSTLVGTGVGNAVVTAPTAGGSIIGVLQNNPGVGNAAELTALGITLWRAGGTLAVGDDVSVDANGYCVKANNGKIVGTALEQAVAGDLPSIFLR